jgi:hypothetical protein
MLAILFYATVTGPLFGAWLERRLAGNGGLAICQEKPP